MHCPNCGTPASGEQQFCRTCGMSLETVGKLVAQHSATPVETQKKIEKAELEQAMVRTMFNWMIWGIIILGIGVFLLVLNKNLELSKWVSLLSSFLILGGTGVATVGVLNAIRQGVSISGAKQVNTSADPKSLPTSPIPELASVTERTTQLIGVEEPGSNKIMDTKARE